MKSRLSATHLLRHLMLFAFIGIFLLTMARAGYLVWQFPAAIADGSIIDIFVTGLRYDAALVCFIILPALVLGCLFGLLSVTRGFARFLVVLILLLGMIFIVLAELITPYFMAEQGIRPDLAALTAIKDPVGTFAGLWSSYLIPAIIGVVLSTLIIVAYIARLEISRMFRFPLAPLSTIALLLIGVALCAFGIYSHYDPLSNAPLSPAASLVSAETVLNEITLNTGYKFLYSVISPFLPTP